MQTLAFYLRIAFALATWFVASTAFALLALPMWGSPSVGSWYGRSISRCMMFAMGVRVVVHHRERHLASQPCVYVANHQSNLDSLFLGAVFPTRTVLIGKREVKFIPLFGIIFAASRNIFIDRRDRSKAISGLDKAVDAMKLRGDSIWIFPEGTRNRSGERLGPFKKGAFHMAIAAQRPVQPIVGSSVSRNVDLRGRRVYGGTWQVDFLEPIPTVGLTADDVEGLMERTHAAMKSALAAIEPEVEGGVVLAA